MKYSTEPIVALPVKSNAANHLKVKIRRHPFRYGILFAVLSLITFIIVPAKTIEKLSAHVYQIKLGNVNCFLVEDSTGFTLVDTGYDGDEDKIFKALKSIHRQPADIKRIVLTHLHADHAGAAASISSLLNIPVYASGADGALLHEGHSMRDTFKVSHGLMNKLLFKLFIKNIKHIKPVENIQYLNDGQLVPGTNFIRTIYTTGHTAGHAIFYIENDKTLLAGDALANNVGLAVSIIYEDVNAGNIALKNTINSIDFETIGFGHGSSLVKKSRVKYNRFIDDI